VPLRRARPGLRCSLAFDCWLLSRARHRNLVDATGGALIDAGCVLGCLAVGLTDA